MSCPEVVTYKEVIENHPECKEDLEKLKECKEYTMKKINQLYFCSGLVVGFIIYTIYGMVL